MRDFDRLVRLGLPVKCNTNTNEKSESTRLLKKLKLRPYCSIQSNIIGVVKFMFSKKAKKIEEILTVYLTLYNKCQIDGEDFVNFCGLLRKHKVYATTLIIIHFTH